jgi:uncharacterized phiE125 gp8 family phage protein
MDFAPVLVTPPAAGDPIVTLAEAKQQCRVDHDDDDDYIATLVAAAVGHIDGYAGILGRCLVTQTWQIALDCWPSDNTIRLPFPDVTPTEVTYTDVGGVDQLVDAALWGSQTDALGGFVYFKKAFTAPDLNDDRPDPIRVKFEAGYGAAENVPPAIKHAIKLLIAHWYENREATVVGQSIFVAELPLAVDRLLAPYRRVGV